MSRTDKLTALEYRQFCETSPGNEGMNQLSLENTSRQWIAGCPLHLLDPEKLSQAHGLDLHGYRNRAAPRYVFARACSYIKTLLVRFCTPWSEFGGNKFIVAKMLHCSSKGSFDSVSWNCIGLMLLAQNIHVCMFSGCSANRSAHAVLKITFRCTKNSLVHKN